MSRAEGPSLDRLSSIKVDGSRNFIHPADVKGRFFSARRIVYALLIAIYVALPLVKIGGHPAVFLDIATRRFYLFGATFNAQDAWLLVFLFIGVGFALLFFTAWLGRVWCGWACPQTVFLEGVYRRIERWIEGPREKRIKRNFGDWNADKVLRKVAKHTAFVLVSLALAHVFISFFTSLSGLFEMVRQDPRENWFVFVWVMAIAGGLYFNFAWFREQMCIVICPYGRLQSAMHDKHSLVIGYDVGRGEPRAKITRADREKKISLPQVTGAPLVAAAPALTPLEALVAEASAAPVEARKGDCIDCRRCVVVCPTGIDIRNGLQLECIGCAQCIDACDEVMIKVGRPTGLIRYDSLAAFAGEEKKVLRPRLVAYGAAMAVALSALAIGSTAGRTPFEANLIRVRGAPYVLDAGNIRNQYELHLVNKNPDEAEFTIEVTGAAAADVTIPTKSVKLGSLEHFRLPIFVSVPDGEFQGPFEVKVEVTDGTSSRHKVVSARFLGPLNHHAAAPPRQNEG